MTTNVAKVFSNSVVSRSFLSKKNQGLLLVGVSLILFFALIAAPVVGNHGDACPAMGCEFTYTIKIKGLFWDTDTYTDTVLVTDTNLLKPIELISFNPILDDIVYFSITETSTGTTFEGDEESDVFLAEGDSVVAWIAKTSGGNLQILASTRNAQHLPHPFHYRLRASGHDTPVVDFGVLLTAEGIETRELAFKNQKDTPKVSIGLTFWGECKDPTDYVCVVAEKEKIDYSMPGALYTGWFPTEGPGLYQQPGYRVESIETQGYGSVSYTLDDTAEKKCLTIDTNICALPFWAGRGKYSAQNTIYGLNNTEYDWSQVKGDFFTVHKDEDPKHVISYNPNIDPISSGASNVIDIAEDTIRYTAQPVFVSPKGATVSLSLSASATEEIFDDVNLENNRHVWVSTDYTEDWFMIKESDRNAPKTITVDQGVKNIDYFEDEAPDEDTIWTVDYIEVFGYTYTDLNGDGRVDAGPLTGWMSSFIDDPDYLENLFYVAFDIKPPLASIDSIYDNPSLIGETVTFEGHGEPRNNGWISRANWTTLIPPKFDSSGATDPSKSNTVFNLHACIDNSICNFDFTDEQILDSGQHQIKFKVEETTAGVNYKLTDSAYDVLDVNIPPIVAISDMSISGIPGNEEFNENGVLTAVKWKDDIFTGGHKHDPIRFLGYVYEPDGYIMEYEWKSSRDGLISDELGFTSESLSLGEHTISFRVKDNLGAWSNTVSQDVIIMRPPTLLVHGICSSGDEAWKGVYSQSLGEHEGYKLDQVEFEYTSGNEAISFSLPNLNDLTQIPNRVTRVIIGPGPFPGSPTVYKKDVFEPYSNGIDQWDGTNGLYGFIGQPAPPGTYRASITIEHELGEEFPIRIMEVTPNNEHIPIGATQVADEIADLTEKHGVPKINLMTHSMGGLNSRHYIQNWRFRKDVNKLVMTGTPNHGSTLPLLFAPAAVETIATGHYSFFTSIGYIFALFGLPPPSLIPLVPDVETAIPMISTYALTELLSLWDVAIAPCMTEPGITTPNAVADLVPTSAVMRSLNLNDKDEGKSYVFEDEPIDYVGTVYGDGHDVDYSMVLGVSTPTLSHLHIDPLGLFDFVVPSLTYGDGAVAQTSAMLMVSNQPLDYVPFNLIDVGHSGMGKNPDVVKEARYFLGDDPPDYLPYNVSSFDITKDLIPHGVFANVSTINGTSIDSMTFEVDADTTNLTNLLRWHAEGGDANLSLSLVSPSGIVFDGTSSLPGFSSYMLEDQLIYTINGIEPGLWNVHVGVETDSTANNINYVISIYGYSDFFIGITEGETLLPGEVFNLTAYVQNNFDLQSGFIVQATMVPALDYGENYGSSVGEYLQTAEPVIINFTDLGDGFYNAAFTNTQFSGMYQVFVTATDPATDSTRLAFTTYFARERYDLRINDPDISLSNDVPDSDGVIRVYADIHNDGTTPVNGVTISFYDGLPGNGTLIADTTIDLPLGGTVATSALWSAKPGMHNLSVIVDPGNLFLDDDISNNIAHKIIAVADSPPVASAGEDQLSQLGRHIFLDGSGSSDDSGIELYEWTILSSTSGTPAVGSTYYGKTAVIDGGSPTTGEIVVELTVHDTAWQVSTDVVEINVVGRLDFNAPTANAGPNLVSVVGIPVAFDGSASSDNFGISLYSWDVDIETDSNFDGDPSNDVDLFGKLALFELGYSEPGLYTAKLTVDDVVGNGPDSDTVTVQVLAKNSECSIIVESGESIQTAIDLSVPGEVICISPGVYTGNVKVDKDDITFDCQGATIKKADPVVAPPGFPGDLLTEVLPEDIGIYMGGTGPVSGVTVQKCNVEGFKVGFLSGPLPADLTGVPIFTAVKSVKNTASGNYFGFVATGSGTTFMEGSSNNNVYGMIEAGTNNVYTSNKITTNSEAGFMYLDVPGTPTWFTASVNKNQVIGNSIVDIDFSAAPISGTFGSRNVCDTTQEWTDEGAGSCTFTTDDIITPEDMLFENRLVVSENTVLSAGTYHLPMGVHVLSSDVTIVCADAVIDGNGFGVGIDTSQISTHLKKNVAIDGCHITDYETGIAFSDHENAIVNDVTITDATFGVTLIASNYAKITAGDIRADTAVAIDDSSLHTDILDSTIYGSLIIAGDQSTVVGSTITGNIHITSNGNNVMSNTITGAKSPSYVTVEDGELNFINGNTIGGANTGVSVTRSILTTISGNVFLEDLAEGISVYGSMDTTLRRNTLDSRDDGIVVFDSTNGMVEFNTVTRKTIDGIYIQNSSNFEVLNNNIDDVNFGIVLANSNESSIHANTVLSVRKASVGLTYSPDSFVSGGNSLSSGTLGTIFRYPYVLSSCQELNEPGLYTLTDNLFASGDCFVITANNVTLECDGHTLTGTGNGKGVSIIGANNAEVRNCVIQYFDDGIYLEDSHYDSITDNVIQDNQIGLRFESSTYNSIESNAVLRNSYGALIRHGSNYNTVSSNNFNDNTVMGLEFWNASSNSLTQNEACDNRDYDLILATAAGTTTSENSCDVALGFACEYTCGGAPIPPGSIELASCSSLDASGSTYVLTNNVTSNGFCMEIMANDITLDCNGYSILGDGFGTGVRVDYANDVTIQNCHIENYMIAINAYESTDLTLSDNVLQNNDGEGFYASNLEGLQLQSNAICYNSFNDISVFNVVGSGGGNTCDSAQGWNDAGATGCTYACLPIGPVGDVAYPIITPLIENQEVLQGSLFDLSWTLYDENPNTYFIYRDGSLVANGPFVDGETITHAVDTSILGTHDYLLSVTDTEGQGSSESVLVTVVEPASTGPILLSSCQVLSAPGALYEITNNLASSGSCIEITAPGITLDCKGYWLRGSDSGTAIRVSADDVTVQNCPVEHFAVGLESHSASNLHVASNSFINNFADGVYVSGMQNLLVEGTFVSDSMRGIDVVNSQNTVIRDNSLWSNDYGIWFSGETNGLVKNNEANNNRLTGIYIHNTVDMLVVDNTALNNVGEDISVYQSSNVILENNTVTT